MVLFHQISIDLLIFWVCLNRAVVGASFCILKVPGSSQLWAKTFFSHFCMILRALRVRILVKIVNFPAAFSGYGTSFALSSLLSYACPLKGECRTVPEQGKNWIFLNFYNIKKSKKLNFFHILRVNSKISLKGPILIPLDLLTPISCSQN